MSGAAITSPANQREARIQRIRAILWSQLRHARYGVMDCEWFARALLDLHDEDWSEVARLRMQERGEFP